MTSVVESPATASALDLPARVPSFQTPFWHRPMPLVAVTHVDPGHTLLTRCFPRSWQHLVRAKSLLDGTAVLDNPRSVPTAMHLARVAPLLTGAAYEFLQFADLEEAVSGPRDVVEQARTAAKRLLGYANTGEWTPVTLSQPRPGQPWLYCGPLKTWAMHATAMPLGLLVVSPRVDYQTEPDTVDARIDVVRAAAEQALGGPLRTTMEQQPTMQIADLLLAGGESSQGHKNFAHFFPLEAPGAVVDGPEFTIVFSNIHGERLRRCSLALLGRYLGQPQEAHAAETLRASMQWFRCHDMAHFWCLDRTRSPGALESLTAFERMTLEETYADIVGLISAASVVPLDRLGRAFAAEMLRYLSRDYRNFADSAAAVLTVGWLRETTGLVGIDGGRWLSSALPVLVDLVRVVHGILWEGGDHGIDAVRAALRSGGEFRDSLTGLFQSVPTDLDYTFG